MDIEKYSKNDIIYDDEVASLIYRIMSAQVVYSLGKLMEDSSNRMQKVFELRVDITTQEMIRLCKKMKKIFLGSDALQKIDGNSSIIVVADLHGQMVHLLRILRTSGMPPQQRYLFLGDYVDRGVQGILIITLLFCLKARYPNHIYLLRGNHEDVNTTLNYGFYDECLNRWPSEDNQKGEEVWLQCIEVFNTMPLAATIGSKVFCSHGGISPFMNSFNDIDKVPRPLIVPAFGVACDLLWSDPSTSDRDGWSLSHRGISFTYGHDIVEEFCKSNDITLIIRGHQLFREFYTSGYVVRFGGLLISLFSALNYENHRNNAAVIKLEFLGSNKHLKVSPIVFRCRHYYPQKNHEMMGYKDCEIMNKKYTKSPAKSKSL